ncbi:MAG TPA: hypothetical protein VF952_18160 [Chloroflexia bacterium]
MHNTLINSIVTPAPGELARRRPSMCHDGTPLVYSLQLDKGDKAPAFRLLVEPGGTGITVPQQISFSLRALDQLLHLLGWQESVEDVNAIVSRVFPSEATPVSHWWGGIWLGMSLDHQSADLRLYLNLRHGEALARWQRVADVLGWFGDEALSATFNRWLAAVSSHATPVGLGVVVAGGRVRGLRVYTGLYAPTQETMEAACLDMAGGDKLKLKLLTDTFTGWLGTFQPQSVTMGYDFRLEATGTLHPAIARVKVDISCQLLPSDKRADVVPVFSDIISAWDFDTTYLHEYLDDLRECFGGYVVEFLSLGFRGELDHVTLYTKPDGCAPG